MADAGRLGSRRAHRQSLFVVVIAAAVTIAIETAAQIPPTLTLTHNGRTWPAQSTVAPVNDLQTAGRAPEDGFWPD